MEEERSRRRVVVWASMASRDWGVRYVGAEVVVGDWDWEGGCCWWRRGGGAVER